MQPALATLVSVIVISVLSFVGILFLTVRERTLKKVLLELVAFSVGALLGDVLIHLLPEIAEELGFTLLVGLTLLGGFLVGFALEKFIHWHHCHGTHCNHGGESNHGERRACSTRRRGITKTKPYAYLNLLGDGLHNLIDGVLIAASYLVSFPVGLATTLAVVLHEIPQEIGDFAVLIHAGWSRGKALLMNFLSALTAIVGAVVTLLLGPRVTGIVPYGLPFAAGIFLYLAASDLVPELHKETHPLRSVGQLLAIFAGVGVMALLLIIE